NIATELRDLLRDRLNEIVEATPWITSARIDSYGARPKLHIETARAATEEEIDILREQFAIDQEPNSERLYWTLDSRLTRSTIAEKLGSKFVSIVDRGPLEREVFVLIAPNVSLADIEPQRLELMKLLNRKVNFLSPNRYPALLRESLQSHDLSERTAALRICLRERSHKASGKAAPKIDSGPKQFKGFKPEDILREVRVSAPDELTVWSTDLLSVPLKKHALDIIRVQGHIAPEDEGVLRPWVRLLARRFGAYIVFQRSVISPGAHRRLADVADDDGVLRSPEVLDDLISKLLGRHEPKNGFTKVKLPEGLKDETKVGYISFDRRARTPDKDDIVHAAALKKGDISCVPIRLKVAFADAAWLVQPHSHIAHHAQRVSSTVYGLRRAVPVLGPGLSFGELSLEVDKERVGLAVELVIDPSGQILKSSFYRAKVMNHASFDMGDATFILDDEMHPHHQTVLALAEAARRLRSARLKSTAFLSFRGDTVGHRIIEEAMIAAKHDIARRFEKAKIPALYRVQAEISLQERKEFIRRIRAAGIPAMHKDFAHPERLKGLLFKLDRAQASNLVHDILSAALVNARHTWSSGFHKGLDLTPYLQFKSLRTFVGLVNQWYAYQLLRIPGIPSISADKRQTYQRSISRKDRVHSELSGTLVLYERIQDALAERGKQFSASVLSVGPDDVRVQVSGFERPAKLVVDDGLLDSLELGQQLTATLDGYDTKAHTFRFIY
ncbi:MAG: RNB domain-containing ribonuclease, partial [Bdellovibrionales bacterium]|nr:RNB domain-containing ribonuclease [Bdellovibrionales bacterium]